MVSFSVVLALFSVCKKQVNALCAVCLYTLTSYTRPIQVLLVKRFYDFSRLYISDWRFSALAMTTGSVLYAMPDAIAMYGLLRDYNLMKSVATLGLLAPFVNHRFFMTAMMFTITFVKRLLCWRASVECCLTNPEAMHVLCGIENMNEQSNKDLIDFQNNKFYKFLPSSIYFKNIVTNTRLIFKMLISLLSVALISQKKGPTMLALLCPIAYMIMENVKNYTQHLAARRNYVEIGNDGLASDDIDTAPQITRHRVTNLCTNKGEYGFHSFELACMGFFNTSSTLKRSYDFCSSQVSRVFSRSH